MSDTAKLRQCCGQDPWYEAAPQYEDDTVSEIWTRLECHSCHAMTKEFPKAEQAEEAWNAVEVKIPEWAKK